MRLIASTGAGAVLAPLAFGLPASWAAPELTVAEDGTYIVMLKDDALASYSGGIQGIPATKPGTGEKLDVESSAAQRYADHLVAAQDAVLESVGKDGSDKIYEYTTVFNGFAAELTARDVQALRKNPDVLFVWEDEVYHADTVTTPDYLGMRGEGGVWDTQFGGPSNAGSGIVVGVIDSGIWPENPSFAALPGDPQPPATWNGICDAGDPSDPAGQVQCNSKLIGARYYAAGNNTQYDFVSPRDTNGHGSHVSGTAAGNDGVDITVFETPMGTGSGMAPAAHIATYKALWQTADGRGSGTGAGLVAAINDAVADGVDVINYSVSGSSQYVVDAVELAFLEAADAGVFVAASAGNSGDTVGPGSVAHNSPWLTTVAASTHDRNVSKYAETGGTDIVDRIAGGNRYETAARIAMSEYSADDVSTVYIATGDQFADALSGSAPAAKGLTPASTTSQMRTMAAPDGSAAPVLLTRTGTVPTATREAIEALSPDNIVILGGGEAVSDAVETDLQQYGEVSRVAGADRYRTAALLAAQYGQADRVYVATGEGNHFADALSGSALAGAEGVPVMLVRKGMVPDAVTEALASLGDPEVIVLGGTDAVSGDVATALGATDRIWGGNRYTTSVAVAERFDFSQESPADAVYVATGADYPDALAGAAVAGARGVPVMLSRPEAVPPAALESMQGMAPGEVLVLGGTDALSTDVEQTLEDTFNTEGERYEGVGVGEDAGPAPLVDSEFIPAAGATAANARLCLPGSLDPAAAEGNIVICTRGSNARTQKSEVVGDAGGVGMILANNNDTESLNADFHSLPSIHVNGTDGAAIKAYAANDPEPTAYISAVGEGSSSQVVPEMAGFSSYGPAVAGGGDLLKPDITAPGVDIIAAVSPAGAPGTNFDSYSGTSMSAPHVAGLAALMMDKNEDWGPLAVKSAMMTTADPTNSEGEPIHYAGAPASPLHYGSGEVEPAAAYDTPLVYESGRADWWAYTCAIGQLQLLPGGQAACDGLPAVDPSDLNYPSIAVGQLAGTQTITRTVTATGEGGTFTAEVEAPEGMTVSVSPASITVPADGTAEFQVTITNQSAAVDAWAFGSVTWTGPGADVRSPIAVRPVAVAAPENVVVEGTAGSTTYDVVPGSTGTMTTQVHGLVPAQTQVVEVESDGPSGGDGIADAFVPVTIPEGAATYRVEVWEDEWEPAGLDLDLYLATSDGTVIASSAAAGSDEAITLVAPEAGDYVVAIDYWDGAAGAVATGPLHQYAPAADEGNLDVTPSPTPVTTGVPVTLTATWTGLQAATRYLGVVGYDFGAGEQGWTVVSVTP